MENYKVYVHINKINGKRYYGITCQKVKYRWNNGKSYKFYIDKNGNRQGNEHFWNSICKYGWHNFEHIVLFDNLTKKEAGLLEQMYIALYDTINPKYGYNQSLGGEGAKHSKESRKKMSEAHKGKTLSEEHRNNISKSLKGKIKSEEHRRKLSESFKCRVISEETRKKISKTLKGYEISEETRKKISKSNKKSWENEERRKKQSNSLKGHEVSEETRKKISKSNKGKQFSEEHRNNLSKSHKKNVYIVELDKTFESITDCAEFLKCTQPSVSSVLRNKTKTCKGYHIIYAKEKELED